MNRLRWLLARAGERLGGAGLLALLLAAGLALYLGLVLRPTQLRLAELERQPARVAALAAPVASPTAAASAFLAAFPHPDTLAVQLPALFEAARQYDLDLGEVSYKWERKRDEPLQRYQVSFAVEAPYPDIRAFLADVLAVLPHAALDQLAFSRDSVRSDTVQATVRLTFLLVRP